VWVTALPALGKWFQGLIAALARSFCKSRWQITRLSKK
jgi:hypothetical protein